MTVYVVFYKLKLKDGSETYRIDGVYDSPEKALERVKSLERKYNFQADFETFVIE